MKQKTKWYKGEDFKTGVNRFYFWLEEGDGNSIYFFQDADVRWVNCYGHKIGDVLLWSMHDNKYRYGKIVGDV